MKIKLQEILDNRNISVYSLSKEIGVTGNNLGKLVKGETTSIKYDILEKLCNILNITPNDIFEIEPQLTLFNYNKDKKKLLNEDTLQLIDKFKKESSNDETLPVEYNLNIKQSKNKEDIRAFSEFTVSWEISQFLNKVISNVVSNFNLDYKYSQIFKNYTDDDNILAINTMLDKYYLALFSLLSSQDNYTMVCALLIELKRIYNNGGLEKLTDEKLNNLLIMVKHYHENNLYLNTKKD